MKNNEPVRGRPKKSIGKRVKKIDARFTEDEYALIQELERTLGIRKSDLVRNGVLKDAPVIALNAKSLIVLLDSIGGELGRCGNNINQLAKHANILSTRDGSSISVINEFNVLFAVYLHNQKSLETALRKIIRVLGNNRL